MGWIARRRRRRDARAAQELAAFQSLAAVNGAAIIAVDSVYQVGRRGSKARVRANGLPFQRDAWFWWTRVRPGTLAAVYMSEGWGSHTGREDVLYIGTRSAPGVLAVLDGRTCARAARHASTSGLPVAATPVLNQPPQPLSAGRIARRTILITVLTCMAPLSLFYCVGRSEELRSDKDLDSAFASTCSYSAGTSKAHALTDSGPRPIYLIENTTIQRASTSIRDQLATDSADTQTWRPSRVSAVQLIVCVSGLGDGDFVKKITCQPNGTGQNTRQLDLRNGKYRIAVHEARTGRQIASTDIDGESFPLDALNDDTTRLCGTNPATVDPYRRGVVLSALSAAQIHQLVDVFVTGPKP
ncbi:hypothetical protein [Nocardia yunnanensis]|uniref:hypothetical protein n=1 Tax=Nocardia yunnanensis TaxID=2382165 RepID=UPI0013C4748E|nr:hypothetical protein [Nocardia yunnanensis]